MLREEDRLLKPIDIKEQIPWEEAEAIVVLCKMPKGQANKLHMSSISVDEISFLSKQLDSHVVCLLGMMKEGE